MDAPVWDDMSENTTESSDFSVRRRTSTQRRLNPNATEFVLHSTEDTTSTVNITRDVVQHTTNPQPMDTDGQPAGGTVRSRNMNASVQTQSIGLFSQYTTVPEEIRSVLNRTDWHTLNFQRPLINITRSIEEVMPGRASDSDYPILRSIWQFLTGTAIGQSLFSFGSVFVATTAYTCTVKLLLSLPLPDRYKRGLRYLSELPMHLVTRIYSNIAAQFYQRYSQTPPPPRQSFEMVVVDQEKAPIAVDHAGEGDAREKQLVKAPKAVETDKAVVPEDADKNAEAVLKFEKMSDPGSPDRDSGFFSPPVKESQYCAASRLWDLGSIRTASLDIQKEQAERLLFFNAARDRQLVAHEASELYDNSAQDKSGEGSTEAVEDPRGKENPFLQLHVPQPGPSNSTPAGKVLMHPLKLSPITGFRSLLEQPEDGGVMDLQADLSPEDLEVSLGEGLVNLERNLHALDEEDGDQALITYHSALQEAQSLLRSETNDVVAALDERLQILASAEMQYTAICLRSGRLVDYNPDLISRGGFYKGKGKGKGKGRGKK